MKVTGSAVLHAGAERVFDALVDPAVLVRTIPGCRQLEQVSADRYRATISAGVASIKGTYAGEVRLDEVVRPSSFLMRASGSGGPGTVQADVRVSLRDDGDGGTAVDYDADAVVGGMIGGVGQRVLGSVAKRMAGEFFAAVDRELVGDAVEVPAAASLDAVASPRVYSRPLSAAPAGRRDFVLGLVVGAALILIGVFVGWLLAG